MIDKEYAYKAINFLTHSKVKKQSPVLITCRCPYCGDSKTNQFKTRGFILERNNGKFHYYCHNCNISVPFYKLLEDHLPQLYTTYSLEKFKKFNQNNISLDIEEKTNKNVVTIQHLIKNNFIQPIDSLNANHPANQYVNKRLIPSRFSNLLFFTNDFGKIVNLFNHQEKNQIPEPRLIFAFINDNKLIGLQGRSLDKNNKIKYITLRNSCYASYPFLFNSDNLDFNKTVWLTEGPIDSMMISNATAVAGSNLTEEAKRYFQPFKDKLVFIFDNERKNKQIVNQMSKIIELGYSLVIWPKYFKYKDLNEAIISQDYDSHELQQLLVQNVFSDKLSAKLALASWTLN